MAESNINHEERGEGVPVVLLHGFPFDHTIWRGQLEGMSKEARVLAPDLPGFGDSAPLADTEPSMDRYANQLLEWANEVGLDRFVLVGHSMGGYIAFALARIHPERLLGLGLVCTRPGPDTEQAREGRYKLINAVWEQGPQAVVDAMLPKLLSSQTKEKQPETVDSLRELMLRQRAEGIVPALQAMASRPDSSPLLPAITVPTLIVSGEEDTIIPGEEAELMASMIGGARHVRIASAAHMPMLEKPDELTEMLRELARGASTQPEVPEPPALQEIEGVRTHD